MKINHLTPKMDSCPEF